MSGLVRGKIECVINTGNRQDQTQVFFKNLFDFFNTHPNYTIIALQYGLTGSNLPNSTTSGMGTGYYDQAASFGYNSFFVARANATTARPFDVYYLFQWGGTVNQTGANTVLGAAIGPGAPALSNGSSQPQGGNNTTLMVQAAIGIGGTSGSAGSPNNGNPWKGTNVATGSDLKPTIGPVWGAPPGGGTGAMVFPRSNDGNVGGLQQAGAFISRTQNGSQVYSISTDAGLQTRMHIVGDDDSWCVAIDNSDNGNYYFGYWGLYEPRANVAQNIPYPYCSIMSYNNIPINFADQSIYGDIAGTSSQQGGIALTFTGSVGQLQIDVPVNNFAVDTNFNPDHQAPGNAYNEWPIWAGVFENNPAQLSGFLGYITFIKYMFNVPTNDTKSDFSRIVLGSTTLQQQKISMPWDSQNNTVPRSGASRAGVTFVTNLGGGL
jgi:hypothetical protein